MTEKEKEKKEEKKGGEERRRRKEEEGEKKEKEKEKKEGKKEEKKFLHTGGREGGPIKGSTRGPRGPKNFACVKKMTNMRYACRLNKLL